MLHKARARPSNSLSHGCAVPAPSKRELQIVDKKLSGQGFAPPLSFSSG